MVLFTNVLSLLLSSTSLPFQQPTHNHVELTKKHFLDKAMSAFIENLLIEWDVAGAAVAVVKMPGTEEDENPYGAEWVVETAGYGIAHRSGREMTADVSWGWSITMSGYSLTLTQNCLYRVSSVSLPIPSSVRKHSPGIQAQPASVVPDLTNDRRPIVATVDAYAVGLLVHNQSNSLEWSTKMKDIVPEWELMDSVASEQADLVDLLSE